MLLWETVLVRVIPVLADILLPVLSQYKWHPETVQRACVLHVWHFSQTAHVWNDCFLTGEDNKYDANREWRVNKPLSQQVDAGVVQGLKEQDAMQGRCSTDASEGETGKFWGLIRLPIWGIWHEKSEVNVHDIVQLRSPASPSWQDLLHFAATYLWYSHYSLVKIFCSKSKNATVSISQIRRLTNLVCRIISH